MTELAEKVGLHKSTVHRFMVNLDAAGLVERNPRNGRYIEVHLAPSHQWWASTFLAVRQPVHPDGHPLPLSRVIHRTAAGATSWEGEVRVPARVVCQLLDSPSLDGLRTNFSAVWFPPGGHACYYSLAPLHGPKPNFHQPDLWLPLHIP